MLGQALAQSSQLLQSELAEQSGVTSQTPPIAVLPRMQVVQRLPGDVPPQYELEHSKMQSPGFMHSQLKSSWSNVIEPAGWLVSQQEAHCMADLVAHTASLPVPPSAPPVVVPLHHRVTWVAAIWQSMHEAQSKLCPSPVM
jgi:hypothetical protein